MGKFIFVYLNFYVFRQQAMRQKLLKWMVANIVRFQPVLYFFINHFFLFIIVVPKYLNFTTFLRNLVPILCYDFALHSGDL
jgi:hypothetical protein